MAIKDLHLLPRVEDGWSFLYVQQCRIEQDGKSISVWEDTGRTAVPCAALSLLMLGPGTAITHAAVRTLAESGCMILWCGEEGVRVYGVGLGETRSSRNLLRQASVLSEKYVYKVSQPCRESSPRPQSIRTAWDSGCADPSSRA